jgi:hypothetical protein
MQIRFIANDVVKTERIRSLFATHQVASFRDAQGVNHNFQVAWSGPHLRAGLWESLAEWIGDLDITAIPVGVATGVVANYLWSLIQHGRGSKPLPGSSATARVDQMPPPFEGLSGVKIVVTNQGKQFELDPLNADYGMVEILVGSFINGKDASQIQNP